MEWVFGAITLACAVFILQMLLEYNSQRTLLMPQFKQVRDVRERYESEIAKIEELAKEAETQLGTLNQEEERLKKIVAEQDDKIRALNEKADNKG